MWKPEWVISDGEIIPYMDAKIHPLSLAVTYATAVFEGLRAYRNPDDGSYSFFRLKEHIERLQVGMKVMRFDRRIEVDEMQEALTRLVLANKPDTDVYIRLMVLITATGLMATRGPVSYFAAATPREKPKFAETGMQLGVSSWSRLSDNASPPRIKATGNYHNARLTQLQAQADGYDGALMLTSQGKVSEAPIACFFMVRKGELITPSLSSSVLESVTRDSIIRLYEHHFGRPVIQREIDRSELYFAEEAFLCGTGQEIIPVIGIDRLPVGDGKVGEITRRVQSLYFDCVRRIMPDEWGWHTNL